MTENNGGDEVLTDSSKEDFPVCGHSKSPCFKFEARESGEKHDSRQTEHSWELVDFLIPQECV